jgi:regulator of protease activity HflC (stomatin/prohibitin superfamily)
MFFVTINEFEAGLVYVNGKMTRCVGAGRTWTWRPWSNVRVERVDLRTRTLTVPGQEIMTRDKVTVRATVALQFRVVDPLRALHEAQDFHEKLYQDVQVALRALVASMEVDALLESKEEIGRGLMERAAPEAEACGLKLEKVALKDVTVPGELRAIMNRVVEAKKAAQASLISAREEMAVLRLRQNTVALIRENPPLLELMRLETLKEMAKNKGNTFVFGAPVMMPPSA